MFFFGYYILTIFICSLQSSLTSKSSRKYCNIKITQDELDHDK